MTVACS